MSVMRAKLVLQNVKQLRADDPNVAPVDQLTFRAVCKDDYDETGLDENNTFSTFTPSVELNMSVTNPALVGRFKRGQTFYVDFTEIE